jgi:hypothetical protein
MPDILAMLTHERDKLNRAIEALGGEIGGTLGRIARLGRIVKEETRKTISAESRARMAAGQKARWAKLKAPAAPLKAAAKLAPSLTAAPKKKYTLSPEARANISAGAKARWVRIKAGK